LRAVVGAVALEADADAVEFVRSAFERRFEVRIVVQNAVVVRRQRLVPIGIGESQPDFKDAISAEEGMRGRCLREGKRSCEECDEVSNTSRIDCARAARSQIRGNRFLTVAARKRQTRTA
jgi:hypothetical protein